PKHIGTSGVESHGLIFSRDQHDLARVALEQKLLLRFHDGAQGMHAGDQRLDFIPLDVANEVFKYMLIEHRATEQAQILEIQCPQIECHHQSADCTGDRVAPAAPQNIEQFGELAAADHIDHRIDPLSSQCCE